ncbi:MAG TPA: glutamate--cysteine ligase [Burkholderiales bacterium]|jgi:glutamate--cysteine ligase|nr:glutamate--cysteine ligase [Burkholderiales bacterium]
MDRLEDQLRALGPAALKGIRRGIEKESLRVRSDGSLALTPHPVALGSALSHPNITTDFSESQLELITGVSGSAEDCFADITRIHQAVVHGNAGEMLWGSSMPCHLPGDDEIPIGLYGRSNIGRAKSVYRMGLAWRYGRRMQAISGIHYNFSLPGRGNDGYLALIRNFRRHGWLLFYLFGASPAVCSSFVEGREHRLQVLTEGTMYLPHATTLRMGRLGYQSDAQSSITASCNSLEAYGAALEEALTRSYPAYEKIGIQGPEGLDVDGVSYRQLATSLIQIENEFYGKIRPKRIIRSGERPLHALRERGIEYVEVRLMDLDPFEPVGINTGTMKFLDVFLLHCAFSSSPRDTPEELASVGRNQEKVATRGREPGLKLERGSQTVALAEWAGQILAECEPIAAALDDAHGGRGHREALAAAVSVLNDPDSAPSARVLAAMKSEHGNTYTRFVVAQSKKHHAALKALPFSAETAADFKRKAQESIEKQKAVEAADTQPFEEWRKLYLSRDKLHPKGEKR